MHSRHTCLLFLEVTSQKKEMAIVQVWSCIVLSLSIQFLTSHAIDNGVLPEDCTPSLNLGGLVFSDYSRRPREHALHWSKAQSNDISFVVSATTRSITSSFRGWNHPYRVNVHAYALTVYMWRGLFVGYRGESPSPPLCNMGARWAGLVLFELSPL